MVNLQPGSVAAAGRRDPRPAARFPADLGAVFHFARSPGWVFRRRFALDEGRVISRRDEDGIPLPAAAKAGGEFPFRFFRLFNFSLVNPLILGYCSSLRRGLSQSKGSAWSFSAQRVWMVLSPRVSGQVGCVMT